MQSKKPALGKGLSALLPPRQPSSAPEHIIAAATGPHAEPPQEKDKVLELAIDAISPNPFQPRQQFDETALDELAASIRAHGLLQPVLVTRRQNQWVLVAGERRWRAAQRVGLSTIPAIAVEISDREALEVALVENLQREDLNPIEEAQTMQMLMTEHKLTQEELSERLGKSRSAVANTLRLLTLPEGVRALVESGELSSGHARCLVALKSDESKLRLARKIVAEGLSVRAVEEMVKSYSEAPKPRRKKQPVPEIESAENTLSSALGTRVQITGNLKQGKIILNYYSSEQLESLYELLTSER